MKRILKITTQDRRGSTLLIVLSLLGLLSFVGMVFYTFSAQERATADYFSENAKKANSITDDPFPWALQQIISGPTNNQKSSILWSPRRRLSMLAGAVGYDAVPHSGEGNHVIYSAGGLPILDNDYDDVDDEIAASLTPVQNPLNFVDSIAAFGNTNIASYGVTEQTLTNARRAFREPDVDYTYPDINNVFLGYKGWAIRDNGTSVPPTNRYERVPVFIPSFMRPALMKSGMANGASGGNTPTDLDWYDHSAHELYAVRSMRPSQHHIAGYLPNGTPVPRYIDATVPADVALGVGVFPLRPSEDVNPANFGQLGLYTGHDPGDVATGGPANFRLDQDNDGDGIFEGIWLDTGYPVQETAAGVLYATMHSFTIYDLGALIDLNSHGNITQLNRTETITDQTGGAPPGPGRSTPLATTPLSASHQGLGPNEVSPIWALATDGTLGSGQPFADPVRGYGANPTNRLEQANMEWLWLLTGRIDNSDNVWDGRWGDANALWYHVHRNDGSGGSPGDRRISSLPRPGRGGDLSQTTTSNINFGGYKGFDDNGDALDGVAHKRTGRIRGFRHPLDIGGSGRTTLFGDPRIPLFNNDPSIPNNPERWLQYDGYSLVGTSGGVGTIFNEQMFLAGRDQDLAVTADNLIANPRFNLAFEDPLEMINDLDRAVRPDDAMYAPSDIVPGHLTSGDAAASTSNLSERLQNLGVEAFGGSNSAIAERFTTISNTLRSVIHRHDLGANLTNDGGTGDDGPRWWEWTADVDNDGKGEFPPQFGPPGAEIPPFTPVTSGTPGDPFRAVVRRLLTSEAGEARNLISQLPLSINHILDVNRNAHTPPESSPQFLPYLQRAGMRFRPLTEHPYATDTDSTGNTLSSLTTIPTVGSTAGTTALRNFPPRTLGDREFWARRDRQQLARDIYVLLYTIGGAETSSTAEIQNATGDNSGFTIYSHEELRRMAQFAVNMVDAMDSDDVVTKFEYDKNLGNGWDLDDDPYTDDPALPTNEPETGNGLYPLDDASTQPSPNDDPSRRGVVFGVEAQQLSFSEALAVRFEDFAKYPDAMPDDATTMFNDTAATMQHVNPDTDRRDRYVLHLELQNNQPYPVPLSLNGVTGTVAAGNTGEHAIWQLARVDRVGANTDPQAITPVQTMSFMDGNADISGGDRFSIGMATTSNTNPGDSLRDDPLGIGTADLYLQPTGGANYPLISPDVAAAAINIGDMPMPFCDLDTIYDRTATDTHQPRFVYNINTSDKGKFLENIPYNSAATQYQGNEAFELPAATAPDEASVLTGQGFEVVLRRRLNPNMPLLQPLDLNPWIEVDRIRVEFKDLFNITNSMATYTATPDLTQITSDERDEALDATDLVDTAHPASAADNRYNTIGSPNDRNSGVKFRLYQPHFDRDFASPVELFQLPLVGPKLLTSRLHRMRFAPYQQTLASVPKTPMDPPGTGPPDPAWLSSAVGMFLQPDFPGTGGSTNDNAWYRLLQFVEVPSRVNTMLGNYLTRRRLPGKININGIRHIEVYAGLIDDALFADVPPQLTPGSPPLDADNQYAPFMSSSSSPIPYDNVIARPTGATGLTGVPGGPSAALSVRDRWFEYVAERDGPITAMYDPVAGGITTFWIPGTPAAKPFRSLDRRTPVVNSTSDSDVTTDDTILRRSRLDIGGAVTDNRNWLEEGASDFHENPDDGAPPAEPGATQRERHQILAKLFNNTTTVSDSFIVYGTAAYFRAYEDPASGLIRVGGRMGLDLDNNGTETDDAGWERRAVFIIDRTELLNAYDEGTGNFDWQRLIKYRADLPSDGQ